MRILASNPDTIGDVVLRAPMYRAFQHAGHEVTLIVRPLLAPVVHSLVPGAKVIVSDLNLYDPRLDSSSNELDGIAAEAVESRPEVFVVAAFQWTALEERLSLELSDVRCVAMTGRLFHDVGYGPAPESSLRCDDRVSVAEDVPEVRKNELLASAVLGEAVRLPDPAIEAAPEFLAAADAQLARLGLEAGKYWVACVGDDENTSIRNWRVESWGEALRTWAERHGRKFLFIGRDRERATAARVRETMGDQRDAAVLWWGLGDGDLDVMIGLIARSAGYVGRDTGPMHLAAALGKPVLAVFGGGTWPRFLPAAEPSIALSVGAPCAGCGWVCHLPESYCIKGVPVRAVLDAVEEIEAGAAKGRAVRLIAPDAVMLSAIGREGAAAARQHMTQLSVTRRKHMEQTDSLTALLERAVKQAGRAESLAAEVEALKSEMSRRESILHQRLAAEENTFRAREAELHRKIAELESRVEDPRVAQRAAQAEARSGDLATRLAQAQEELARANADLLRYKAEASDARLRVQRLEADQNVLNTLTRQQGNEVVVLRERLGELMASRWRRYGQRLGLCMTMPWEREMVNGKH